MKRNLVTLFRTLLVFIVFFLVLWLINYSTTKDFADDTMDLSFNGVIDSAYKDSNDHGRRKVVINKGNEVLIYDLENESSGLFEYVRTGDSIEKEKNSLKIHIFNSDADTCFILTF